MKRARIPAPDMVADLLKLLRGTTLNREEIREDLGWQPRTVTTWCECLVDNGILIKGEAPATMLRRASTTYRLAPEWIGQSRPIGGGK